MLSSLSQLKKGVGYCCSTWITIKGHRQRTNIYCDLVAGTDELQISNKLVWQPDLVLYSSVAEIYGPSFTNNIINISPNGSILYMYPARLEVSCPLDITHFPFDQQSCPLLLGSWAFDGNKVCTIPTCD